MNEETKTFIKGCVATAPNGNKWRRDDVGGWDIMSPDDIGLTPIRDCDVSALGLTVTWPIVTIEDWGSTSWSKVPEEWLGETVLVIRKDRCRKLKLSDADVYSDASNLAGKTVIVLEEPNV